MLIQQKIGNLQDFETDNRTVDWLNLEWFEVNKRILTKQTTLGTTLHLKFLGENPQYTEGDVLFQNDKTIIAVCILMCDVIVLKPKGAYEIASVCYEIGNKHLPLFIDGDELLIPFEMPLFNMLTAANYIVSKEQRQLTKQLKTTVSPHVDNNNNSKSLFTRILDLTSK